MSMFMAEMIGTTIMLVFGLGTGAALTLKKSFAKGAGWLATATGWGFAVLLGAYAVGDISGAHMNSAVTIANAVVGNLEWALVPQYIGGQFAGAIIASTIVWLAYLPHWAETDDPGAKLGIFSTSPAIPNTATNLLAEVIGTFMLVFVSSCIGRNAISPGVGPFATYALIVAIGLALGGSTGYAINPARDLGPRIAHAILPIAGKGDSNWSYAWIPVVGPIVGATLGAVVFGFIF